MHEERCCTFDMEDHLQRIFVNFSAVTAEAKWEDLQTLQEKYISVVRGSSWVRNTTISLGKINENMLNILREYKSILSNTINIYNSTVKSNGYLIVRLIPNTST